MFLQLYHRLLHLIQSMPLRIFYEQFHNIIFLIENFVFLSVEKDQPEPIEADSLSRELLETNKCYLLDCGIEVFVWMGRNSPLEKRKNASSAAEVMLNTFIFTGLLYPWCWYHDAYSSICVQELIRGHNRPKSHVIRVIEGFETVIFRSKFDSWPQTAGVTVSEDGRGKVAGQWVLIVNLL